jgi:hypothetical protein
MGEWTEREVTTKTNAAVAQLVERVLGKDEVLGSNPSGSFLGFVPKPGGVRVRSRRSRPRPSGGLSRCGPLVDVWGGGAVLRLKN